ncbi:TVP38/TMEM64 family protein [Paenibacillus albicereus]|uniref:TVP38/TMEM64 family membrane protein n=2 Tax=Paenibacillus albicereus TaxID=2726185 RepID=A0A6H2H471_9BACL|nr:TVP38/TMEM64 family protein [Paenibacillus albicereus]
MNGWIDALVAASGLDGPAILLLTIPLAVLQGLFGLFPFATIILIHISILGIAGGLLASWLAGTVAALVVYLLFRYFFYGKVQRRFQARLARYERYQASLDEYGGWMVILLRTIPVMPNNLISFMSAVAPVKFMPYLWSSVIGNLSHIWMFGLISSSLIFPGHDLRLLIFAYLAFLLVLTIAFAGVRARKAFRKRKMLRMSDEKPSTTFPL